MRLIRKLLLADRRTRDGSYLVDFIVALLAGLVVLAIDKFS
jgi:hypothetical protein